MSEAALQATGAALTLPWPWDKYTMPVDGCQLDTIQFTGVKYPGKMLYPLLESDRYHFLALAFWHIAPSMLY
jgi:hypothetical protein